MAHPHTYDMNDGRTLVKAGHEAEGKFHDGGYGHGRPVGMADTETESAVGSQDSGSGIKLDRWTGKTNKGGQWRRQVRRQTPCFAGRLSLSLGNLQYSLSTCLFSLFCQRDIPCTLPPTRHGICSIPAYLPSSASCSHWPWFDMVLILWLPLAWNKRLPAGTFLIFPALLLLSNMLR